MTAYRRVDDLRSPAGWLPVHRDQLRAQRLVSSMRSLYLFKYIIGHIGDGFLRVKWPNRQQCQSTEGISSPKDRLQSHQVHLTMLQYYTCIQCTQNNESTYSEMDSVRQNPIQKTVMSVHVCALHCALLLHTILHRTHLINFPLTPQTINIAPTMSIWGKGTSVRWWWHGLVSLHASGKARKIHCQ